MANERIDLTNPEDLRAELERLRRENARLTRQLDARSTRSELLLRRVLDVLPVGVFIADEHGGIAWTNSAVERIWGGARYVPMQRLTEYRGWWADTGEPVEEWAFARAFVKGETSIDEVVDIECFDGSRKTILNSAAPVTNERGEIISAVAVIADITQLRQTEEALRASQERLSRAISIDSVGVLFFDMESTFLDANDAFLRMIGHSREELERGELRSDLVTLPEWMPRTQQVFEELKRRGRFKPYAKELVRPDGSRWWGLFAGARLDENEAVEFVIDITERRKMQQELEAAVEAKHQLMRELNHRVKNNLYLVSNLIHMKDASLGSTADLSDIRGHMSTIMNLHEKLYEQDAVRQVEFEPFLRSLLTDVFSFCVHGKVDLAVESEVGSLSADTAATLGLILNEIATNAMKHGYQEGVPPSFAVSIDEASTTSEYVMTVSQNGRALPEDVMLPESGSSGLGLVQMLVSQLKGHMELEREPTPTFRIRFPME
ncbi:MAG: sensor histidine kinase [Spirochaetota bacterium]